jgi:hypothetical protein
VWLLWAVCLLVVRNVSVPVADHCVSVAVDLYCCWICCFAVVVQSADLFAALL